MAKAKLAALFDSARGELGPYVVARGKGGPIVRRKPTYRRRATPDQLLQERRMATVAAVWASLSRAEALAWGAYGRTLLRTSPGGSRPYSPSGYNAFTGLALLLERLDPGGPIPRTPPVGGFAGDEAEIEAEPVSGALRFTASAPNRAGIVTELMAQRLLNVRRSPTARYPGIAYRSFPPGELAVEAPVEPGVYAPAYRFIERATGRATMVEPLEIVVVE